ncbi:MAG: hypothetical protein R6X15_07295 [Pseudomonadota bacterium]
MNNKPTQHHAMVALTAYVGMLQQGFKPGPAANPCAPKNPCAAKPMPNPCAAKNLCAPKSQ